MNRISEESVVSIALKFMRTHTHAQKYSKEQAAKIIQKNYRHRRTWKKFKTFLLKDPELAQGRMRNRLIRDIIKTEQTYVDNLNELVKYYLDPLKNGQKKHLSQGEIKSIFSNGTS